MSPSQEFLSEDICVQLLAPPPQTPEEASILSPDALRFVGYLCQRFESRRRALLEQRQVRATAYDAGCTPDFIPPQEQPWNVNQDSPNWQCAPVPACVQDRRVEITGPVDRKMVINGLNSGACVYMADFEDSTSPTWSSLIQGHINLRDAVRRTISYTHPTSGKVYQLHDKTSVLFVRPRGWHLPEGHVIVNGQVASGAIFDFALFLFHNHAHLALQGMGPFFYLPKMESHYEARLWNHVFVAAQQYLGLPLGTIRATVLIETLPAAFCMEEILYELRDHSLGLNCGRWDYLFSYMKTLKYHADKVTPDRQHMTMTTPLMQAYVQRLVQICHRRGTFAMGGMSAALPIKGDPAAHEKAIKQVEADKLREVLAGHDGTWVAHPALVTVAKQIFDQHMKTPNQIHNIPNTGGAAMDDHVKRELLRLPELPAHQSPRTSADLSKGVSIVLAYTEAWLCGIGCIPLHHMMEDAATAEMSRVQIWTWRTHQLSTVDVMTNGHHRQQELPITAQRIRDLVQQHVQENLQKSGGKQGKWLLAGKLVENMLNKEESLDDFLTSVCYPHILTTHQCPAATTTSMHNNSKL